VLPLLGGNVTVDGGGLAAWGGRVDIGSIVGKGTIDLVRAGGFEFTNNLRRGDVQFERGSLVDVRLENGGNIQVIGKNINVLSNSILSAGIFNNSGTVTSQSGLLTLNATETVLLAGDASRILNDVSRGATGQGGDIDIRAMEVVVQDGARVSASTFGMGDSGNIKITAYDRALFQVTSTDGLLSSGVFSNVEANGVGNGGNIVIDTGVLEVLNGAQLVASTFGDGDAGDIQISARDRAHFQGTSIDGQISSAAGSNVTATGIGNGGGVIINTAILEVGDGAQISADTFGNGNAGRVRVFASEDILINRGLITSNVGTIQGDPIFGNAGAIDLEANKITLTNGGQVQSGFYRNSQGQSSVVSLITRDSVTITSEFHTVQSGVFANVEAGSVANGSYVLLNAPTVRIEGSGLVFSGNEGQGQGGDIQIYSNNVSLVNGGSLRTRLRGTGQGKGGDIDIGTGTFTATGGSQLDAITEGQGDAGNIRLNASNRILFQGVNSNGQAVSGASSSVQAGARGNGGDILISANVLEISDGAIVTAQTLGNGNAGNIEIQTRDQVTLDQGSILISSVGNRAAGSLNLTAPRLLLGNNSRIDADSNAVNGGNISLNLTQALAMGNSSLISATAGRAQAGGDGGNITINSPFVLAIPQENNDIIANAFSGTGGNIIINAQGILNFTLNENGKPFEQLRSQATNDISASSQFGTQGVLNLAGLNVDPSRGSVQLPIGLIDSANRLDNPCGSSSKTSQGSFVITGRGGLAADPSSLRYAPTSDWVSLDRSAQPTAALSAQPASPRLEQPIEANDWHQNAQGHIQIIATAPASPLSHHVLNTRNCRLNDETDR
jgi:large exoprotein involved in heme utilization and adhesion